MKKFAILFLSFVPLVISAQVKLDAGKKITAVTTTNMDLDLGMLGQMKIVSDVTNVIDIKSSDGNAYKAENTVTKMKMSQEGGGQSNSFDSEKKEDAESAAGKELSGTLNKPEPVLIDRTTGKVKDANPEKPSATDDEENPFADFMGETGASAEAVAAAFYVLPVGKNPGDKWSDSTNENGLKVVKNYELQSVKNGIATLAVHGTKIGSVKKSMDGSDVDVTVNGKTETTLTTDIATGVVKKNVTTTNMDGSVEVMGQSLPITMTMSATAVFE